MEGPGVILSLTNMTNFSIFIFSAMIDDLFGKSSTVTIIKSLLYRRYPSQCGTLPRNLANYNNYDKNGMI